MRITILSALLGVLAAGQAFAQEPSPPTRPPLASVDSRWSDVYCDLTEVARTGASELSVRYRYRNTKKTAHSLPHVNLVPRTQVFDPIGRTMFGVLKDSSGNPLSSSMLNGQAARPVPARGAQAHWVRLEAPAATVTAVTVLIDGCQPIDDVPIGSSSSAAPKADPSAAIATQEAEFENVSAEITGINRTAGGFLAITFRYRNSGKTSFTFPNQAKVRTTYFVDSANRRKYEVLRNQDKEWLCSDTLQLTFPSGDRVAAGEALAVWAKFAAPPDTTKAITVHLPFAPPFDNVPIAGSASGSAGEGAAVAGAVVGLEAALKDLGAKVSDAEIRIDLSADVLFDFDKADIKKDAEPSLQKVATVLNAHRGAKVSIDGHTDGKGTDAYNQTLSEQRAASVKQWLVANGKVDAAGIATRGWGKTKPIAHNTKPDGSDDPEGRAKNRRVEIVVRKGA